MAAADSRPPSPRLSFDSALLDAGGVRAPRERLAGLRTALLEELESGARELGLARSGYRRPVAVALATVAAGTAEGRERAATPPWLVAVAPVDKALRADPGVVGERAWLLVAAVVGAMVEAVGLTAPTPPRGGASSAHHPPPLYLRAGALGPWLALALPLASRAPHPTSPDAGDTPELAALAFEDESAGIDRLRARAYAVPAGVLDGVGDLRPPIGADHPLRTAEVVARLGGRPADEDSVAGYEDAVLALLGPTPDAARPHEELDPGLRAARRILQRLAGMGKWGGYHTDVAHLSRGFAGNERALATDVGERLVDAGLLLSKPSVGQRHVYLNPRRAADIHGLIERGTIPAGLELPRPRA